MTKRPTAEDGERWKNGADAIHRFWRALFAVWVYWMLLGWLHVPVRATELIGVIVGAVLYTCWPWISRSR